MFFFFCFLLLFLWVRSKRERVKEKYIKKKKKKKRAQERKNTILRGELIPVRTKWPLGIRVWALTQRKRKKVTRIELLAIADRIAMEMTALFSRLSWCVYLNKRKESSIFQITIQQHSTWQSLSPTLFDGWIIVLFSNQGFRSFWQNYSQLPNYESVRIITINHHVYGCVNVLAFICTWPLDISNFVATYFFNETSNPRHRSIYNCFTGHSKFMDFRSTGQGQIPVFRLPFFFLSFFLSFFFNASTFDDLMHLVLKLNLYWNKPTAPTISIQTTQYTCDSWHFLEQPQQL